MSRSFTQLFPRTWLVMGAVAYVLWLGYWLLIEASLLVGVLPLVFVAVAFALSRRSAPA